MSSEDPLDRNDRFPARSTRRMLLGAVGTLLFGAAAGLPSLRPAAADGDRRTVGQNEEPPRVPDTGRPPYPRPGLLAQSRLKPDVVALMRDAKRFRATRRAELSGDAPRDASRASLLIESRRFSFVPPASSRTEPDQAVMARRLTDLLLRDELWTGVEQRYPDFTPDFVFTFCDTFPGVTVSVSPRGHSIQIDWINSESHASRSSRLLFDPVGEEMTAFIKDAFPGDAAARTLTFTPAPEPAVSRMKRPTEISPEVWAKANALRTGMTRADVLAVFEEEGGLFNRMGQTYILRKNISRGPYPKINVQFAPADVPLYWRGGKGFLQNVEDTPRAARGRGLPGDIITGISPIYEGYFIAD